MNFIQLQTTDHRRRIGLVFESEIKLLTQFSSTYDLFLEAVNGPSSLTQLVDHHSNGESMNYDEIYSGGSSFWKILPPIDVPNNPMMCLLSGTGLTHRGSAENRQKMHQAEREGELSDSMKLFLWGEKGGKPPEGEVGVQPEWFYKGNGSILKGHGEPLSVPFYADDGGEEPEVAGVYVVSTEGVPTRIGFVQANEFSDHVMEKKNYLYLAPSKLRNCAIGPELVTEIEFDAIPGKVTILRNSQTVWAADITTGEQAMAHSLSNLEHHHFKYAQHRLPGQLHIHFFGADAFSFGDKVPLQDNDLMRVQFDGMGRPLANSLHTKQGEETLERIDVLD